jgi:hypothetical protein
VDFRFPTHRSGVAVAVREDTATHGRPGQLRRSPRRACGL